MIKTDSKRMTSNHSNSNDLRPTWPITDFVEQSVSWASSSSILTMTQKSGWKVKINKSFQTLSACNKLPVSGGKTSPVAGTDDESLSDVTGSNWWQDWCEISHEAETDRARVEPWAVSSLTIPSSTFIDDSGVSNAEVVTNISPSVSSHVPAT